MTAIIFCNCMKRRIYRRLNYNLISRISKGSNRIHQKWQNSIGIFNPIRIYIPTETNLFPSSRCFFKFKTLYRVTITWVLCSLFNSICNFFWHRKICICNPHGDYILWICRLILFTLRYSSVNYFIKIVFHNFIKSFPSY